MAEFEDRRGILTIKSPSPDIDSSNDQDQAMAAGTSTAPRGGDEEAGPEQARHDDGHRPSGWNPPDETQIFKEALPPWWRRRIVVCPLLLLVAGLSAIGAGVAMTMGGAPSPASSSESQDGADDGASSTLGDAADDGPDTAGGAPSLDNDGTPLEPAPTPSPSAEGTSGGTSHVAWEALARTVPPTGYVGRPPTSSPYPSPPTTSSLPPTVPFPTRAPTISPPPTDECWRVDVAIDYDTFPNEISWHVRRAHAAAGDVLRSYEEEHHAAIDHRSSVCLPEGEYEFTISDAYGDGMLAPGYYSLESYGNLIHIADGLFGHNETIAFHLPFDPAMSAAHLSLNHGTSEGAGEDEHPVHEDFILDIVEENLFGDGEIGV